MSSSTDRKKCLKVFYQSVDHEIKYDDGRLTLKQTKTVKRTGNEVEVIFIRQINGKKLKVREVKKDEVKVKVTRSVEHDLTEEELEEFRRIWRSKWKPRLTSKEELKIESELMRKSNKHMKK